MMLLAWGMSASRSTRLDLNLSQGSASEGMSLCVLVPKLALVTLSQDRSGGAEPLAGSGVQQSRGKCA